MHAQSSMQQLQAVSTPSFLSWHQVLLGIVFCLYSCPYLQPKHPFGLGCRTTGVQPLSRLQALSAESDERAWVCGQGSSEAAWE